MSKIDTNVLHDGQLAVATVDQSGTITKKSAINTNILVQTEDGEQLCVATYPLNGGGGGGGGDGADTDLSNLTNTGKIKAAHLAMPSDVVETLSIPTANTYLTAPADGYYYAMTRTLIDMTLFQRGTTSWDDDKIIFRAIQNTGFEYGYAIIPVSAGQVLHVGPTTILSFKFIYLNGNSN